MRVSQLANTKGEIMAGSPIKSERYAVMDSDADYIIELLEQGESMKTISVRLTDKHETHISYAMVGRWCQQERNAERVSRARALAADHRAESILDRSSELVRDVALGLKGRDDIAATRLANDADQWIAGVWNKRYAPQTGAQVQVNIGAVHLDSLRATSIEPPRPAELDAFDVADVDFKEVEQPVLKADLF